MEQVLTVAKKEIRKDVQSMCKLVDGIRKDAKGREVGFRVAPPNHHEPRALRRKPKMFASFD